MKLPNLVIACAMACSLGNPASPGAAGAPDASATAAPSQTNGPVVISALLYDGYETDDADEAFQITNISTRSVTLDSRWSVLDQANHGLAFAPITLTAAARAWIAKDPVAFKRQFGFTPTLGYAQMSGSGLSFANTGGSLRLITTTAPITTPTVYALVDTANATNGLARWAAGSKTPRASMERLNPHAPDIPSNWQTVTAPSAARDTAGYPITGTPGLANPVTLTPTGAISPPIVAVVINEIAWSGTTISPTGEWVELRNNLAVTVPIEGWKLIISGTSLYTTTLGGQIGPRDTFVIQRHAATFQPANVADLTSGSVQLRDGGAMLKLISATVGTTTAATQTLVDTLVYGTGDPQPGWRGPALQPYLVGGSITAEGQVLMRKWSTVARLPVPDTDSAQDWINERNDPVGGRRPIKAGWDYETFAVPVVATSPITIAITPDGGFDVLARALASASTSIDIEVFTFDQARLADLLVARSNEGVTVRVLLDGSPPGGIENQERWICMRLSMTSNPKSGCWFMRSNAASNIRARYDNLHSKFAIVDHRVLTVASENFGVNAYPDDDKSDGTVGHRGVLAVLEAPALVARAQAIFDADLDTAHRDIMRWCVSASCYPYGPPSPGFTPVYTTGGVSYTVRFGGPLAVGTAVTVELATSPENNLRNGGIVGILNAAGAGDEVLIEQLDEPYYWGTIVSNPVDDPNPRLQAAIGAAARGARVWVVLDHFYDDDTNLRSNHATAQYLAGLARTNRWDLHVGVADPTRHGIHDKLILASVGGRKYAQIGSWNGSEASAKLNREMTILVESGQVYDFLRNVVAYDLWMSQPAYMPVAFKDYAAPVPVNHPLVSEILFNPAGADETGREWIELYNPTPYAISLSGFKVGDAEAPSSKMNDGMYQFPLTATIPAHGTVLVAENAALFEQEWGRMPDFEIADYDAAVPELLPYTAWSTGTFSLANSGDQVALLGPGDQVVDAAVWGAATLTGTQSISVTIGPNHTLQRWPIDQDTDDCAVDFRDQAMPSPRDIP